MLRQLRSWLLRQLWTCVRGLFRRLVPSWRTFSWFYLLLVLIPLATIYLVSSRQAGLMSRTLYHRAPKGSCVAWRATFGCHPFGFRDMPKDQSCNTVIQGTAGYCECARRMTVARVPCGAHSFTCSEKCEELAFNPLLGMELPAPLTCNVSADYSLRALHVVPEGGAKTNRTRARSDGEALASRSREIWDALDAVIVQHGLSQDVVLPGVRNSRHDWVMEGLRLRRADTERVRDAVRGFLADLPEYPADAFQGRGVVMVAGGLKYMVPAWTSVHMLRKTGCKLAVEMWFPVNEFPTAALEAALLPLGVLCRRFDERDLDQHGFTIKVAAMVLSQFEEVLFLDADNIALRDPTYLFNVEPYERTGAVFWPDFWSNTVAPDLLDALGVPYALTPSSSFESGQMLVDKRRHWRGLALATYMNAYATLYYELLSCFLGKGDKETFGYGMLGAGEALHLMPRVKSAGVLQTLCDKGTTKCSVIFTGNTMVQHDQDGDLLFMHSNYEKQTLAVVGDFQHYNRRWQVLQPGLVDMPPMLQNMFGFDPERLVYDTVVAFRCAPWFDSYYKTRIRLGDKAQAALDGFSPLVTGIQFDHLYMRGWPGELDDLLSPSYRTVWRRLQRFYFGRVYHFLMPWLRWFKYKRRG